MKKRVSVQASAGRRRLVGWMDGWVNDSRMNSWEMDGYEGGRTERWVDQDTSRCSVRGLC